MASRARIELDRFEILVLFGILVLFSGLMFTFGIMVGYGLPKAAGHEVAHAAASESGHGHETADAHAARVPASEKTRSSEDKVAGTSLKQAFREAKQQALTEAVLREQDRESQRPASVPDATAHMEANPQWNHVPAAAEDSADVAAVAKAHDQEAAREKAGPPSTVKTLFERKPSAVDHFVPNSGSYTVQLGSYATEDESKAKVSALRKAGFNDAYYQATDLPNGDRWYRVGMGSYTSSAWAKKAGERVTKRKFAVDFIVRRVP